MPFEFFTDSGRGFRPRVSIRKQGQIGLNQGAVRRFLIREGMCVILGYDRDAGCVALKLTEDRDEAGAQRVIIKNGSASISARSFLEYFGIPYRDKTRQYDVTQDEEHGLLIVALNTEDGKGVAASESPTD